ncbi:MAG: acetate--CoA ligase family protein, partial [Pseudomonadota bacterium]
MTADEIVGAARVTGRTVLDEMAGKHLLARYGVAVPKGVVLRVASEANAALSELTPPFAVKVMSPHILHKSDAGGVRLGLRHAGEVSEAIAEMGQRPAILAAKVEGWLIEEMAPPGVELVIGALRDQRFGQMLMVGLGGIFVEVLADVAFRICPITCEDARSMLDELRGGALLDGARGRQAISRDAIIELLLRLGGANGLLARHAGEFAEVDLNPVIVTPGGAVVVDARFILGPVELPLPAPKRAPRDELPVLERFAPLLAPRTIAVLGASGSAVTIANTFIRRLKNYGYPGAIYPIHPSAGEIEGLAAYASLAATPEPVD